MSAEEGPERKICDTKRVIRVSICCLLVLMGVLVISSRSSNPYKLQAHDTYIGHSTKILVIPAKATQLNETTVHLQENYRTIELHSSSHQLQATTEDATVTPDQAHPKGEGYVFVSHYSDQMTGASLNILSLQCWVSTVSPHVRVVEPFLIRGSKFGINLTSGDREVRLRDILDIEGWESQLSTKGYAPFISWKDFLNNAPSNLIIVSNECTGSSIKCESSERRFQKSISIFLEENNFNAVRRVYIKKKSYSSLEFKELVYGSNQPNQTVVLFNSWGGVVSGASRAFRVGLSDLGECKRKEFPSFVFQTSEIVRNDSKHYMDRYMPMSKDGGYISVMLRTERFGLSHDFQATQSTEKKLAMFTTCVDGISAYVRKLKSQYNTQSVFLAMDCRKQGSMAFRDESSPEYMSKDLVDTMTTLLYHKLYGNSSSLNDWDESFDKVASFKTPGYLAQLQKTLAANGACLLMAGGGNFQLSAETLYNETRRSTDSHCAIQIPGC